MSHKNLQKTLITVLHWPIKLSQDMSESYFLWTSFVPVNITIVLYKRYFCIENLPVWLPHIVVTLKQLLNRTGILLFFNQYISHAVTYFSLCMVLLAFFLNLNICASWKTVSMATDSIRYLVIVVILGFSAGVYSREYIIQHNSSLINIY